MNQMNGPTMWPPNGMPPDLSAGMGQFASLQSPYSKPANNTINSIDTESVLSGYSERSKKSRNGGTAAYASLLSTPGVNSTMLSMSPNQQTNNSPMTSTNPYHTQTLQHHLNNSGQQMIITNQHNNLASTTLGRQSLGKNDGNHVYGQLSKIESPYDISNRTEMIEVRNLDDNWGENTTAVTGNTSDHSGSFDDLSRTGKIYPMGNSLQMQCQMWSGTVIAIVLSSCAFLSPILMIVLPKLDMFEWKTKECGPECDGLLISFIFKMLILLVGSWAVFFRRPKATMPRVCVYRAAVLTLVVIFMVAYWLFYSVRIAEKRFNEEDAIGYHSIVLFAISFVDALLFIHYLAVILLEIRHLDSQYFIKVVRSPDGYSQCYNLGTISIQRASVWILEKYYQDFPIYNPHLDRVPSSRRGRKSSLSSNRHESAALKYYDIDGPPSLNGQQKAGNSNVPVQLSPKSILAQNTAANAMSKSKTGRQSYMNGGSTIGGGGGGGGELNRTNRRDRDTASHMSGHSAHHRHHNDRFYVEHEYERRVRKRKSRLVSITEEAFTHIKRVQMNRSKY